MSFITPAIRGITSDEKCRCGSDWREVTIMGATPLSDAGRWVVCPNPNCIVKIEGEATAVRAWEEERARQAAMNLQLEFGVESAQP